MKKFVRYFLWISLSAILLMVILDFIYTKVYDTSEPRTKFQYLRSLRNHNINYVFLGSSRVENSIIPSVIEKKTGKKAVNLGFQASKLEDIYTVLKLLKDYNIKSEKIYIQVDYIYSIDGYSNILQYEMVPFINENMTIRNHITKISPNTAFAYSVPFIRFCDNDLKLGIREVALNLLKKKTNVLQNSGYVPLKGTSKNHKFGLPKEIKRTNQFFIKIDNFCKENKIDVVYYCAPFCRHTTNMDYVSKLKSEIPSLVDFSSVIDNEEMFLNASHLNEHGAEKFTNIFIENLMVKSEK